MYGTTCKKLCKWSRDLSEFHTLTAYGSNTLLQISCHFTQFLTKILSKFHLKIPTCVTTHINRAWEPHVNPDTFTFYSLSKKMIKIAKHIYRELHEMWLFIWNRFFGLITSNRDFSRKSVSSRFMLYTLTIHVSHTFVQFLNKLIKIQINSDSHTECIDPHFNYHVHFPRSKEIATSKPV